MLDTWMVDDDDLTVASDADVAVIDEARENGKSIFALGDPETGDVVCFLYVDQFLRDEPIPVVLLKEEILTSA